MANKLRTWISQPETFELFTTIFFMKNKTTLLVARDSLVVDEDILDGSDINLSFTLEKIQERCQAEVSREEEDGID